MRANETAPGVTQDRLVAPHFRTRPIVFCVSVNHNKGMVGYRNERENMQEPRPLIQEAKGDCCMLLTIAGPGLSGALVHVGNIPGPIVSTKFIALPWNIVPIWTFLVRYKNR